MNQYNFVVYSMSKEKTITVFKQGDFTLVEIDNLKDQMYGSTTASGTVEQATQLGFLSCGSGANYRITDQDREEIQRQVAIL
jgi:hypothetical protein